MQTPSVGDVHAILVGDNGSEQARDALALAEVLRDAVGGQDQPTGESSQRSTSATDDPAGRSVRSGKWREAETSASSSNT